MGNTRASYKNSLKKEQSWGTQNFNKTLIQSDRNQSTVVLAKELDIYNETKLRIQK